MSFNIIFAISVLMVMYFLPIIIIKGVRRQAVTWVSLLPFALGVTGIVLFFFDMY